MAEIVTGIPNFEESLEAMKISVDEAARKFVLQGAEVILSLIHISEPERPY